MPFAVLLRRCAIIGSKPTTFPGTGKRFWRIRLPPGCGAGDSVVDPAAPLAQCIGFIDNELFDNFIRTAPGPKSARACFHEEDRLTAKLKESAVSVIPVMAIVVLLHLTIAPLPAGQLSQFILGGALLIVGLSVFLIGADLGMVPFG